MAQSALYIVGIGPGGLNHMTFEAREHWSHPM